MKRLKREVGLAAVAVLLAFPLLEWVFIKPIGLRFISYTAALTSFGQVTGLLGISLFAVTLILSWRFKSIEGFFGGIDRVYTLHHKLGIFAFILLLAHPLFLAFRLVPVSITSAALFLLPSGPSGDLATNFGIFSLLLLIGLMITTVFARIRYQKLKSSHKFLGFAFFLGGLHTFLIPSDVSRDMVLRTYILSLAGVALGVYVYRTVLGKFLVRRHAYAVEAVSQLGDVTEVVMKPLGRIMHYSPGQFLFVSFHDGNISTEVHPFSISSAPNEDVLRISVKALGDYTSDIKNLRPGATAKIEGPFGRFSYLLARHKRQVWIAGGIGITPFLNMARNLEMSGDNKYSIELYYCTKNEEEAVYLKELMDIADRVPGFRVVPFCSDNSGHLTANRVAEISGGVASKDFFICGPPPMMENLKSQFLALRVPRSSIHQEAFKLL